jgi:energy-coupling factor transporter transmembrane protein EcfT
MKIFNFLLAVIFLVFAFTKINDPQPIPGILMYGAMAVICIMAMFKVYYRWLIILLIIPLMYYAAIVHLSAQEWVHSGGAEHGQEASDFFQLALAIFVLAFQLFRSFRNN